LKFTPGCSAEITKMTYDQLAIENYPRMTATGFSGSLSFLVHRAVLYLYGGPNNTLKPFRDSQDFVGDHLECDIKDFSAPMVHWLLQLQNIEKEKVMYKT
jgi:hypothetical protein